MKVLYCVGKIEERFDLPAGVLEHFKSHLPPESEAAIELVSGRTIIGQRFTTYVFAVRCFGHEVTGFGAQPCRLAQAIADQCRLANWQRKYVDIHLDSQVEKVLEQLYPEPVSAEQLGE